MIDCTAVLFDLDDTLVDVSGVDERMWRVWADLHSLDPVAVVGAARTGRPMDAVQQFLPGANLLAELQRLEAIERSEVSRVHIHAGALEAISMLLPDQWAIVTPEQRELALARISACNVPTPLVLVTGDDVTRQAPDPEAYLAAAIRLGVDPSDCVAFDNTPDGIHAALLAGCTTIAIATTHPPEELFAAHGIVNHLGEIRIGRRDGRLVISLRS